MIITNFSIKHRIAVFVLMFAVAILGAFSYATLPRESTPDIKLPLVTVAVPYPEASPADVETEVTIPLERELKNLKGLDELTSISVEGMSVTTCKFYPTVSVEEALQRVREKFDAVKGDFPEDVEDETIDELSFSEFPIMIVTLFGADIPVLQKVAERIEDKIESVPGILNVSISGGLEPQIEIEIDPERLAAYNLPINRLIAQLKGENVNISAGGIDTGGMKPSVRIPGEFKTAEDVNSLIVYQVEGRPVYLRDVASAKLNAKDPTSFARRDGMPSVQLSIQKRAGENIILISEIIKHGLKEGSSEFPDGVEYVILVDESKQIRSMVSDLENNIISGLILVLIVILIAMGARNALFVALAVPFSLGMSFFILQLMGFTLNMVVLFSLILAQGMLVDNAIVIIENIYRHIGLGKSPVRAAKEATAEVAWPVITATFTTVAAFFPMIFWPGIMGEFMSYLPITVIVTLLCSLFVALVINPTMAAAFMRFRPPATRQSTRRLAAAGQAVLAGYERLLRRALARPWLSLAIGVGVFAGTVSLYAAVNLGEEMFPETEPRIAFVNITAAEGTSLAQTDRLARIVEARLPEYADIDGVETTVGGVGGASNPMQSSADATHLARVAISFKPVLELEGSPRDYLEELRPIIADLPGAEFEIQKQAMGPPTGPKVNVEVSVDNDEELPAAMERVRRIVEQIPGVVDLRDDNRTGKPEFRIQVDRQKAALLGLNSQWIGDFVKMLINGRRIGGYDDGSEERDIIVRLPAEMRNDPSVLDQIRISDAMGNAIPLSTVCTWDYTGGYGTIRRKDGRRVLTVSSGVAKGAKAEVILEQIRQRVDQERASFPAGFEVKFTGEREDQEEASNFLRKAFVIALILISFILVLEFNSVLQAGIIIASVALSLVGVMVSLIVLQQKFGVIMTGVAIIALAGVVVNNAIIMIDYTNRLRRIHGKKLTDAIVTAGKTRMRPVMLTAITTTLGLVPMAIGVSFDFRKFNIVVGGESSAWWAPLATAVIFGLMIATLLTLVLVPVMYKLTSGLSDRGGRFFHDLLGSPDELAQEQTPAPELAPEPRESRQ